MNLIPKIKKPVKKFRVFVPSSIHLSQLEKLTELTGHFLNSALVEASEKVFRILSTQNYIFNIEEEYEQD